MMRAFVAIVMLCSCGRANFDLQHLADADGPGGGDPSSVKLVTKHVYGQPGGTFSVGWTGGEAADLQVRFVSATHRVVHTSSVTANGTISLPATAGLYRVELRDPTTGGLSHGQATITKPVSGFTAIQSRSFAPYGQYVPQWPNVAMLTADIDGDGDLDWVRSSGKVTTGLADTGFHITHYDSSTGLFTETALVRLANHRICGFAIFDRDHDGDDDLVAVAEELSTFELRVCVLAGDGTGGFSLPACQMIATGTATEYLSCGGGIAAGDLDRDGRVDLVFAGWVGDGDSMLATRTSSELRVLRNTADAFVTAATWSAPTTLTGFSSMAIADVDDDGRLDILANGGEPSRLHVFRATANFSFAEPEVLETAHGDFAYDAIVPAYVDGDTTLDVIVTHPDGPSSIFVNDGATLRATRIPSFTEQHGSRMHVLDFDVDGEVDIFIPYKNRFLQMDRVGGMRKTASNLTELVTPEPSNTFYGALPVDNWVLGNYTFGDWDRDGRLDALVFIAYSYQMEALRGE